jgi:hypothetical protein
MVKENRTFEEFTENKGLSKKEGFSINYSLGTVTPGLPTLKREFILNSLFCCS